jgi:hypothetical protein
MTEKLDDKFDLDSAVLDKNGRAIEEEDITPPGRAAQKSKRPPGYLYMSAQVKARLTPQGRPELSPTQRAKASVSGPALQVLCCLLDLEFQALDKGEPLILSNAALARWGGTKHTKIGGLNELCRRGLVTYTQEGNKCPRVTMSTNLLR